ncbi:hypothetical protein KR044_007070, partial [Drosophila immigrans]
RKYKYLYLFNTISFTGDHCDSQLKMIGFDMPDDFSLLLDKCVDIQMGTYLYELCMNNLREFYYTKKRESIENKVITGQQAAELKKLKSLIEATDKEIKILEKFKDNVSKRLMTEATLKRNLIAIESKSKSLLDRQKNFIMEEDFNIIALIDKVEALEAR